MAQIRSPQSSPIDYTQHPAFQQALPAMEALRQDRTADEFNAWRRRLAEREEPGLRKRDPHHPMLKMLDEMREQDRQQIALLLERSRTA
jgi:hypothetical protein